jgi:hypothetical protein
LNFHTLVRPEFVAINTGMLLWNHQRLQFQDVNEGIVVPARQDGPPEQLFPNGPGVIAAEEL